MFTLDVSSPAFQENPYPLLKHLREFAPLCRVEPIGMWGFSRYGDVSQFLNQHKQMSARAMGDAGTIFERARKYFPQVSLLGMDPPEHTPLRKILSKAFTTKSILALRPKIEERCASLMAQVPKNKPFDFVDAFSMPLPVQVIASLLGVDSSFAKDFKRWSDDVMRFQTVTCMPDSPERIAEENKLLQSFQELEDFTKAEIAKRKHTPSDDLITLLVHELENTQHSVEPLLISMIRLLLVAGNETTTNLLNTAMHYLASHSDMLEKLQKTPDLIEPFIEECLRFDGPALGTLREVAYDQEIYGHTLRKGDRVTLFIGSANHDETVFANPEQFDIYRTNLKDHLAFGKGVHYCIGAQLARLEASCALSAFLKDMRGLTLGKNGIQRDASFLVRGMYHLNLEIQ